MLSGVPACGCLTWSRLIQAMSHRYPIWQVFSDFVEMSAITLSNAVD
jgi:hypothetical protein